MQPQNPIQINNGTPTRNAQYRSAGGKKVAYDDADDSKSHERVFMVCHELLQLRVIRASSPPGYVPDLGMIAIDLRRYARFSQPGANPCQEHKDSGTACNASRSQRPPFSDRKLPDSLRVNSEVATAARFRTSVEAAAWSWTLESNTPEAGEPARVVGPGLPCGPSGRRSR